MSHGYFFMDRQNGLLGRPLPPLGLITALASLGAVKTALGRQRPPSKTIFPVHEKNIPRDMNFPVMKDTLFPFESHSTFLASFWTKIGQNRSKSVKNRTKIGSKSDKNSFFIISRSCRPFWVPTCLLLKKKSKNRFYRRTVNRRAKITSFLDFRVYKGINIMNVAGNKWMLREINECYGK